MYEGYLLYPYRPSSGKNRMRWQFGVLGPPGAAAAGVGEEPGMAVQCLLRVCGPHPELLIRLRFLQLQHRQPYDRNGVPVEELEAAVRWTSWGEAVEREVTLSIPLGDLERPLTSPVEVPGGEDMERVVAEDGTEVGCIVRSRSPLSAELSAGLTQIDGLSRLEVGVRNTSAGNWEGFSREHPAASSPESPAAQESDPARLSLLGAHLLLQAHDAAFVSLLDPPPDAAAAAAVCRQCRCWPVLAGDPGEHNLVLGSPIILYDYPQVAPESATALYDATEIDEILTLRVMTMTE